MTPVPMEAYMAMFCLTIIEVWHVMVWEIILLNFYTLSHFG